eukprot:PhM_4_TR14550/c0_g1_i1/m.106918/K12164/UBA5, UBE1DC1; ubiquitin-like modifier-activating enzyme 5
MSSSEQHQQRGHMSAEVRDDNRHSRLMALQRMGVVKNYEAILEKSVAIVGMGGVGSVVAEMLTRCAIGRLELFDYDTVQLANMNRLFFRPDQCGMTKVEAARVTLQQIDPEVAIGTHPYNITTMDNYDTFKDVISKCDLVLSCVDNFAARMVVNQACLELDKTWMESGVSENAVSGHIQFLVPGATACYQCCPPLVVAAGEKEAKREGVCAASLPTTMGIVAGFLSQHTLKYLLDFGEVNMYIGYDAMKDHFPSIELKANPQCTNEMCLQRQKEHAVTPKGIKREADMPEQKKKIEHKANGWGIVVASSSDGENLSVSNTAASSSSGLEYAFSKEKDVAGTSSKVNVQTEDTVDDLAAKLKALS